MPKRSSDRVGCVRTPTQICARFPRVFDREQVRSVWVVPGHHSAWAMWGRDVIGIVYPTMNSMRDVIGIAHISIMWIPRTKTLVAAILLTPPPHTHTHTHSYRHGKAVAHPSRVLNYVALLNTGGLAVGFLLLLLLFLLISSPRSIDLREYFGK